MHELSIHLVDGKDSFRPGDIIEGEFRWSVDRETNLQAVELRLLWYTQGKGMRDAQIADRVRIQRPGASDGQSFRFVAPRGPYSFSGRLITISWALELVLLPNEEAIQSPLMLSATGSEIRPPAAGAAA